MWSAVRTPPRPPSMCRSNCRTAPKWSLPHEVFGKDQAANLFHTYYISSDIPAGYTLRPVESYTRDGSNIDLREASRPH
jgi:hypothetical protein